MSHVRVPGGRSRRSSSSSNMPREMLTAIANPSRLREESVQDEHEYESTLADGSVQDDGNVEVVNDSNPSFLRFEEDDQQQQHNYGEELPSVPEERQSARRSGSVQSVRRSSSSSRHGKQRGSGAHRTSSASSCHCRGRVL
jgi:hypothetical protein